MKYKTIHSALINVAKAVVMLASFHVAAEEGAIRFSNTAYKQVISKNTDGSVSYNYVDPGLVLPKDIILYEIKFENISEKPVEDIVINNPIANNSTYRDGSATDDVAEVTFSVDGQTFASADALTVRDSNGREWKAKPEDYTAIRWKYKGSLKPGETGTVSYKTEIKESR